MSTQESILRRNRTELYVFLFPFLFVSVSLLIGYFDRPFFEILFGRLEKGIFEWAQFWFYVAAMVVGIMTFRLYRKRSGFRTQRALMLLFAFGCFFIAGEEISWGQQVMHWATPEAMREVNVQGETNLHNLVAFMPRAGDDGVNFLHLIYVFVGLFGGLAWMFKNPRPMHPLYLLRTDWQYSPYFLLVAAFYMLFEYSNEEHFVRIPNVQELFETVLAFGFLLVAIANMRKTKTILGEG